MPAKANQDEMFVKALALLKKKPCATRTLIMECGLYKERAAKLLTLLHSSDLTYIYEWMEPGRCKVKYPFYRWKEDKEKDAPKPPTQTKRDIALKHAAWRTQKRKEALLRKELENESQRASQSGSQDSTEPQCTDLWPA